MAIEINDDVIKSTITRAILSLYDVQEINDALIDNDSSLFAYNEEIKNMVNTLRSMKVDLINALHQYDE